MNELNKNEYLFGIYGDEQHSQEKYLISGSTFIQGVFYDGILENRLGTDFVSCTNDSMPEGVFWVHVNNYENNPAIGFFWDTGRPRGLIVDRNDVKALRAANYHFEQTSNFI